MKIPGLAFEHDAWIDGLSVFCVGGAVRDALLGRPFGDKDWLVVGASPEQMHEKGFIPVGGDFPVFLHPKTKQEYALARTERKSGKGYQGFTFYTGKDVSLEQDLQRRDFTINAMAVDKEGLLYDPYHGLEDLQQSIFRHVGPAFIEDPVRILRLARFLSRFPDFEVAEETQALCLEMVNNAEVDALVPERVWKELSTALRETTPVRFFEYLAKIHALERIIPSFTWNAQKQQRLERMNQKRFSLSLSYALLMWDEEQKELIAKQLRVGREQMEYANTLSLLCESKSVLLSWKYPVDEEQAEKMIALLERVDAFRKPDRFLALLEAFEFLNALEPLSLSQQWAPCLQQLKTLDLKEILKPYIGDPQATKNAVRAARVQFLRDYSK